MSGHIYRSAKGWRAMIDIGPDPITGKRRQRRLGPYRSRREAERAVAKVLFDIQTGQAVDPGLGGVTLADYLREQWLPARELRGLKPTTLANYRWVCEAYLIPRLGTIRLRNLGPREVVAFFEAFSKETGRSGKPRSTRTIALTHRVLSMALGHAVRSGLVARNVAEGARDDLPRGETPVKSEMWTPEELGRFLEATAGDRLYPLWVLAVTTGMRRGELCGLRWEDIDFEQGTLTVRRARVMVHGAATETTPKTAAGQRWIGLDRGGPWRSYGTTNAAKPPTSLSALQGSGKARGTCSPTRSAGRSSPSTSPSASPGLWAKPGYRRSACTTSGIGTPPPCCESAWTSRSPPLGSGTPAPRSPRTSTSTVSSSSIGSPQRRSPSSSSTPQRGRETSGPGGAGPGDSPLAPRHVDPRPR